jgi:hypothetical protein
MENPESVMSWLEAKDGAEGQEPRLRYFKTYGNEAVLPS